MEASKNWVAENWKLLLVAALIVIALIYVFVPGAHAIAPFHAVGTEGFVDTTSVPIR